MLLLKFRNNQYILLSSIQYIGREVTIVCNSHKFIFIHIPKTAGTSVKTALSPLLAPGDIQIGVSVNPKPTQHSADPRWRGLRKHSPASEVKEIVGSESFEQYHKFSVVRNPFTRTRSIFTFLKYNFRGFPKAEVMDDFSTLEEFLKSDFFARLGPSRMFEPQVNWLRNSEGQICIEHIARVETLNHDIAVFLDLVGEGQPLPSLTIGRKNVSRSGKAEYEISGAAADLIRKRYEIDFATFGYSREPGEA